MFCWFAVGCLNNDRTVMSRTPCPMPGVCWRAFLFLRVLRALKSARSGRLSVVFLCITVSREGPAKKGFSGWGWGQEEGACVSGQATSSRDHQASQGGAWGWLLWAPAQQQPEGQRGVQWVKFGVIWHVMWHVICYSIIWYAIYHHIAWWLYNMLYVNMTYNMSYNMSYNMTHTKFDIHRVLQWFFFDFMIDLLSLFSELEEYSWKYLAKFSRNQTKTALYQRVRWEIQTKCLS